MKYFEINSKKLYNDYPWINEPLITKMIDMFKIKYEGHLYKIDWSPEDTTIIYTNYGGVNYTTCKVAINVNFEKFIHLCEKTKKLMSFE